MLCAFLSVSDGFEYNVLAGFSNNDDWKRRMHTLRMRSSSVSVGPSAASAAACCRSAASVASSVALAPGIAYLMCRARYLKLTELPHMPGAQMQQSVDI